MIAEELRLKVANAACPGETSSSLIDSSGPSNGCENVLGRPVGYRTMFPLHVRYRGSQLAYAVSYLRTHHNVRLVSLMIGANDFFVCQETTRDGCLSAGEQQAVFATIAKNARRILSAIRGKAHYRGQLVLVNYYSLNYASSLISGLSRELNAAVDGAGRRFRVEIGDGYGQFLRAARIFGGDPCRAGLLTRLSTGGCGVHPSYAGQALLAQAVLRAVRSKG
jgi:lysophospholipase L1-like esterase